jgi:glycosyltransferase involved in cell wall biosynthesis
VTTIAIDCRFAGTGTGLSRYTTELVEAMLARHDPDVRYVLLVRDVSAIAGVALPHRTVLVDIPHYSRAEQTKLPQVLRATGADLAYFPHFNAPFFCPIPFVATVHDLILHRYPGDASFLKRAAYRILLHRTLRRARSVIAVSEWTRRDVARTYGPRIAKKTVVVGEGVTDEYVPQSQPRIQAVRDRYGLKKPFFLYVGNCKVHKNVQTLVSAFSLAQPDAELVLVSGGAEARALRLPPGAKLLEGVPNDDLPALYSAAKCFVTASLDEGYCLPVAEALACGCPVIASNRAAIPEVLGGNGVLVEPTDDAIAEALLDPPSLAAPVRVGSWEKAAEDAVAVLVDAARKRPR